MTGCKTHILKTWRHAKCTAFDIYEIISRTRTSNQSCRGEKKLKNISFWRKKNQKHFRTKISYNIKIQLWYNCKQGEWQSFYFLVIGFSKYWILLNMWQKCELNNVLVNPCCLLYVTRKKYRNRKIQSYFHQ